MVEFENLCVVLLVGPHFAFAGMSFDCSSTTSSSTCKTPAVNTDRQSLARSTPGLSMGEAMLRARTGRIFDGSSEEVSEYTLPDGTVVSSI